MSAKVITLKIAGPAGAGIKSSGLLFSNILLKHGYNLRDYSEYPSLVRGGHNTYQVSFSSEEIFAPHYLVDLFFSLVPGHWQMHQSELSPDSIVFSDEEGKHRLPLTELSQQLGSSIYANTICLGTAAFILHLDINLCRQTISGQFGSESPNNQAFNLGYDYAAKNYIDLKNIYPQKTPAPSDKVIYDGNEAYGWGFINAGGNLYSAYPMTPATGALHFLAAKQTEHKFTVIHPEDEIAAASIAAGAAFAGSRSAVGTSGGGFALMTETVSLCGAANLGVVFYLVSRPGPATGLPTWTGQGDLLFAVHSGHGEFNKIVLAPGDQQQSFELSVQALNLAAKFNIPVILLSDKFISESSASLPDLSKIKIDISKSTTSLPGTPGHEYLANSYEHGSDGFSTEDSDTIVESVNQRLAQNKDIFAALPKPELIAPKSAKKLIISWGSTRATVLETLRLMGESDFAYLHLTSLWPINPDLRLLIKPFEHITVIENNATAQLVTLLKSQFDFNPNRIILKYDGRPFFPEELAVKLKN